MLLSGGKHRLWIPYSLGSDIRVPLHIPTLLSDARVAEALTHKLGSIDIYSNSWGPEDTGMEIQGPGPQTSAALEKGIKEVFYRVIRAFTTITHAPIVADSTKHHHCDHYLHFRWHFYWESGLSAIAFVQQYMKDERRHLVGFLL